MNRLLAALVVLLFAVPPSTAAVPPAIDRSIDAAAVSKRRRPIRPISTADWLRANSIELASSDVIADTSDLQPIKTWLDGVRVIGLGDGTHGTHEYYTIKKRLIDFLAREEGITLV